MIEPSHNHLSIVKQCDLLKIHRSGLYYNSVPETQQNLHLMRLMDELYLTVPFYGIRRLTKTLQNQGFGVNRKRIRRLMDLMGWQTLYRKRNTSKRNEQHPVYPYLLRGLEINRANQVWAIDITYVPMRKGFMYLCAIIDLHTRYVVNWGISNSMTAEWCKQITQEAIEMHGKPEIMNSDQGSQFTSLEHTELLKANEILISMDGKGRAIDNIFIERLWKSVKYECVYLHAFDDDVKLYEGLKKYFCNEAGLIRLVIKFYAVCSYNNYSFFISYLKAYPSSNFGTNSQICTWLSI
jgi:putative transposase